MNKAQLINFLSDILNPDCAHCTIGRKDCPNPYGSCLFKPTKEFVEAVADRLLDKLR